MSLVQPPGRWGGTDFPPNVTAMSTLTVPTRSVVLAAARIFAGLFGLSKAAGITYFTLIAPDEAIWLGPWIDIPAVGTLVTVTVLLLAVALAPRLTAGRRIGIGLLAVGLDGP